MTTTLTPGPTTGGGTSIHSDGTNVQKLVYDNLEPVTDTAAGSLTINGTNGDDAFDLREGVVLGNALISVNNNETTEFKNKTTLTLNANAGNDTINLAYPYTPHPAGLNGIVVNGGDPTASDTLILNGIPGALDNLRDLPSSDGGGLVINDNQDQVNVTYTGIEHLKIVGKSADGDGVRLDGTTGNDAFTYTQGNTPDSGKFTGTLDKSGASFQMAELTFSGASMPSNDVDFNFFNAGGVDTLQFNGTSANDTLQATGGEAGGVDLRDTVNGDVLSNIEVFNVASVSLLGLGGDDTFSRSSDPTYPVTFQGGSGSGDEIDWTSNANTATTIDLGLKTISSVGMAQTTYSSIETINQTNSGGSPALSVLGTTTSDAFTYSSSDTAGAGTLAATGKPTVNFTGLLNGPSVFPLAGFNSLRFLGTVEADVFDVTLGSTMTALEEGGAAISVPLSSLAYLSFTGDAGIDIFNMTTDSGASPVVHVDGGVPPGKKDGDALNVLLSSADGKGKVSKAGPGTGTVGVTYGSGAHPFFSFENVEKPKVVKF